jgi:transposase
MSQKVLVFKSRKELENYIITAHANGESIRSLARQLEMGRKTVARIINKNKEQRENGNNPIKPKKRVSKEKKLDAFDSQIKELIKKYPNISGKRMFEELVSNGFDGSISMVRQHLRRIRPTSKKEPTPRFETDPGVQGQMDWSPYKINFSQEGKKEVLCFSYILGYSRRQYIDFTLNRKFHTLIRRHQDAFEYFGGVPLQCLYDGEKTVILRYEAGHPVFNPSFIDFITHYKCKPIGVKKAKTKGKVERPFQYVEGNLLNAREFINFEHLKEVARWWMQEKSDLHIHGTTRRSPLELFIEKEADALQSLPNSPYDTSEVKLLTANIEGFVEFETNKYSVPYEYVSDIMSLKATENEIYIYSPYLDLVATHERIAARNFQISENPEHRTSKRIRYGLEPVKESFLLLGKDAPKFLSGLKEKHPHNCGYHARYILQMKEHYHSRDINKALKHANKYYAFDCKSIEQILKVKADKRTLESIRNMMASKELQSKLPKIKQRDLSEYKDLF